MYGQKLPDCEGPAGYGLSEPEPQGTGAFPWGGGSGENDPVDRGREKVGTRLRRGGVVGQPPVCVRHRSGPDKGWMSRRETHAEQPDTG